MDEDKIMFIALSGIPGVVQKPIIYILFVKVPNLLLPFIGANE